MSTAQQDSLNIWLECGQDSTPLEGQHEEKRIVLQHARSRQGICVCECVCALSEKDACNNRKNFTYRRFYEMASQISALILTFR